MTDDVLDLRVCVDLVAPPKRQAARLALVKASLWQPGDAIRITFLDGDPAVHERVKTVARTWMEHANLNLFFQDDPASAADIRITFQGRGSSSYIGTTCRQIQPPAPTMIFGWLSPSSTDEELRRVVLHEFGHALGCIHEHQNPPGGIKWNKEAVYAYYAAGKDPWPPEQVDQNIFQTYDENLLTHTPVDGASIMMYPIDARLTLDGYSVGWNTQLSETDKKFMSETYAR